MTDTASQIQTPAQASSADEPLSVLARSFGAQAYADAYGTQAQFPPSTPEGLADGFVSPLLDIGLLGVSGDEAAKFLHAQLTNDVEHLPQGEARWYGYCSPKGRLLATFVGWRDDQGIRLALSRPLVEAMRKRLSMFVLRTKAKVVDDSTSTVIVGLGGSAAPAGLESLGIAPPAPMATTTVGSLTCIGLAPVSIAGRACARWLLVMPLERSESVWSGLRAGLTEASSSLWRWTEVQAGIPRLVPGTTEQFVPQMLNFELVGGVNFKKGCYPGQEVVARSQYLGKLKRRMFLAHLEGPEPAPGSDVLPAGGGDPCGQVVLAAPAPQGGVDLLFESQTAALEAGAPRAGESALQLRELPYPFPA